VIKVLVFKVWFSLFLKCFAVKLICVLVNVSAGLCWCTMLTIGSYGLHTT
jgi:hypothetical protein